MDGVVRASLLDMLPANVRAAMQRESELLTFEDGREIVRAGETGDAYYLITRGAADVVSPQGMVIATLEPGQGFGELALLLERPRSASVVAHGRMQCLRLSAEQFQHFLQDPEQMFELARALATRQADEIARLEDALLRLKRSLIDSVRTLAAAVEARDPYTGGHIERCGRMGRLLAEEMGLPIEEQERVELAGALHDVGKVAVPDAVLLKPTALDPDELAAIQLHAIAGEAILRQSAYLEAIAPIVRSHHERWDGSGYPDALAGNAIPLGAQIVSVADAFDAITTDRPYRRGRTWEEAVDVVQRADGIHFSPLVVEAFLALARRGALNL